MVIFKKKGKLVSFCYYECFFFSRKFINNIYKKKIFKLFKIYTSLCKFNRLLKTFERNDIHDCSFDYGKTFNKHFFSKCNFTTYFNTLLDFWAGLTFLKAKFFTMMVDLKIQNKIVFIVNATPATQKRFLLSPLLTRVVEPLE